MFTFCTGVTLFALVLHLNCTALSQSESSNFFDTPYNAGQNTVLLFLLLLTSFTFFLLFCSSFLIRFYLVIIIIIIIIIIYYVSKTTEQTSYINSKLFARDTKNRPQFFRYCSGNYFSCISLYFEGYRFYPGMDVFVIQLFIIYTGSNFHHARPPKS